MNLFIIPSWYPSATNQISGIFVKEQAEALAACEPNMHVIVSLWGHADSILLSLRRPLDWLKALYRRIKQANDSIRVCNGVYEVFNPALVWSERLPLGGIQRLVKVNRRNFLLASQVFGKIDLIHAHVSYPAGYIASVLSRELGVPYVLTEHMSPFPFQNLVKDGEPLPEIKQAFEYASEAIAVSPSLSERVASFGYRTPMVIPNLVDERRFFPGDSKADKTIFFTLCGISEQKGIDHLLEAIALWNPPASSFEFRIGGDGPMLESFQAKARNLGIADRVRWLGVVSRDEAPDLFRDCHIFVMPSRHETFGVVYAEAIASGKPIVATRCGGPESIVNDINGKLVDVGDVQGLSQTMQTIAKNLINYDPKTIRHDFELRFSRHSVVEKLLELYESVLRD